MTICQKIKRARGKHHIVEIRKARVQLPHEAAMLFGLSIEPETYHQIDVDEARAVLNNALHKHMAYKTLAVNSLKAENLANEFIVESGGAGARYYTNSTWGAPKADGGASWRSATDATFDTGIIVLADGKASCAWFLDED